MAKTKQTQKKRTPRRGAVRVRRAAAAAYVARQPRGRARDTEVASRINELVEDGAALRREIEERIEARLRERH